RWIRKRDGWFMNREYMQPLDLVGSYMELQARWVEAAAEAEGGRDFAHRLEASDVFMRIDSNVEADVFRGATLSPYELDALRQIDDVVRMGRVRSIGTGSVKFDDGELASRPGEVYIDCTAEGIPSGQPRPVFENGRVTLQYVTIGIAPYSAATIGI